jgi:enoyl-CoA hydratase
MSEHDGVAILELNGGKANSLSSETLDLIERLIDGFEKSTARAAVLTGYERFFSAGLALPLLIELERPAMKAAIEKFARVMMRVFACDKPIVAAINGHALAGGCVLALECDWRIMTDEPSAKIGLNETQLGIGLPTIVIEPLRLQVPPASLVPIAYEGTSFSPDAALRVGLIHEVVPAKELRAVATAKAKTWADLPPAGIAQVKRSIRRAAIDRIERVAAEETELWLDSWFAPGARERLRATVERLKR